MERLRHQLSPVRCDAPVAVRLPNRNFVSDDSIIPVGSTLFRDAVWSRDLYGQLEANLAAAPAPNQVPEVLGSPAQSLPSSRPGSCHPDHVTQKGDHVEQGALPAGVAPDRGLVALKRERLWLAPRCSDDFVNTWYRQRIVLQPVGPSLSIPVVFSKVNGESLKNLSDL